MMLMLIDFPRFDHPASVPWPNRDSAQLDWIAGIQEIESWLRGNVGSHHVAWHWTDSGASHLIGVSFRWNQDRTLFVLTWG
jgi:hypothetical protein